MKTKEELLTKLESVKKDPTLSDLELVIIETLEYLIEDISRIRDKNLLI